MKKTTITALLAAAAMMLVISCSDDPSAPAGDDDGIKWPGMTSRDDVVRTLVLTWSNPKDAKSIAKYRDLLHAQYFFGLDARDVPSGGSPIMTKAGDISSTEWIFTSATILELTLSPVEGQWDEFPELEGEICAGCWQSTRQYFIRAQFGDEDTIYMSPVGRAAVSIVVAPDEEDATKWVIRAMYDLVTH